MNVRSSAPQQRGSTNFWPNMALTLVVLGVPLGLAVIFNSARAASFEQIKSTGALNVPRAGHTANLLTNGSGRVLIVGGTAASGQPTPSAEMYAAGVGTSEQITPMSVARTGHKAKMLDGGWVLVSGGEPGNTSEVFDPLNVSWTLVQPTPIDDLGPVAGPPYSTAVELANGRYLLFGLDVAGLYLSDTNDIVPLENSVALQRAGATATELAGDKKILVAGGTNSINELVAEAAIFNPATVTTDADDYPPGATANITGNGFISGEIVELSLLHADAHEGGTPNTGKEHQPWQVAADMLGNIETTWLVCEDDCIGELLEVTRALTALFPPNGNCQTLPNLFPGVAATDKCTLSGSLTIVQNPAAGTMVGLGTHTITVTAGDAAGNAGSYSPTLIVTDETPLDVRQKLPRRFRLNIRTNFQKFLEQLKASANISRNPPPA